jgi:hypothetical protein
VVTVGRGYFVTCDGKNIKKWRCSLDLFLVLPAKTRNFCPVSFSFEDCEKDRILLLDS